MSRKNELYIQSLAAASEVIAKLPERFRVYSVSTNVDDEVCIMIHRFYEDDRLEDAYSCEYRDYTTDENIGEYSVLVADHVRLAQLYYKNKDQLYRRVSNG